MTDTAESTDEPTAASPFYVTGGTLPTNSKCYIERQADGQLFDALCAGEFCDVLTSRQMGKSSLMVRVADRLRRAGVTVAILDLTALGQNLTPAQWYDGLLLRLGEQLGLEDELDDFLEENQGLSPLQRWMRGIRQEVMGKVTGQMVIFVDEIDFVRSLPFPTDEFFAAIREYYNRRATEQALCRISFCLIGVATPSDLIRETLTTPFNIGKRIELRDFNESDTVTLARGLPQSKDVAPALLARVLYWTGGHPFLTQRFCKSLAERPEINTAAGIDQLCREIFLDRHAIDTDDNLIFVRDRMLLHNEDIPAILDLYCLILNGNTVPCDETNPPVSVLLLSGVARSVHGNLEIRNRIYRTVFNKAWAKRSMPDAEVRRQRAAYRRGMWKASGYAAALLVAIGMAFYIFEYLYVKDYPRYFMAVTMRNGRPYGVGPELDAATVAHRNTSFRLTSPGRWKDATFVEALNGHGQHAIARSFGYHLRGFTGNDVASGESSWHFGFYDNGHTVYEQALNRRGQTVWTLLYLPQNSSDETASPGDSTKRHRPARFETPERFKIIQPSGTIVQFAYDRGTGDELSIEFWDTLARPARGPERAQKIEQTFESKNGYLSKITYELYGKFSWWDENSWFETKSRKYNPITIGLIYGDKDDFHKALVTELDLGTPSGASPGSQEAWCVDMDFDQYGNRISLKLMDSHNTMPAVNRGPLEWVLASFLNPPGFEPNGPNRNGEDFPFSRWTAGYNEHGDMTEVRMFGIDDHPAPSLEGFNRWTADYDEKGNLTTRTYFDDLNKIKAIVKYGNGDETTRTFDEISREYFKYSGEPTSLTPNGPRSIRMEYSKYGQLNSETAYGFDPAMGFVSRTRSFDRHGWETDLKFLNGRRKDVTTSIATACRVARVIPGSRAEFVYHLARGDIVSKYDDLDIRSPQDLYTRMMKNAKPGGNLSGKLKINGNEIIEGFYAIEPGMILEDMETMPPATSATQPKAR